MFAHAKGDEAYRKLTNDSIEALNTVCRWGHIRCFPAAFFVSHHAQGC